MLRWLFLVAMLLLLSTATHARPQVSPIAWGYLVYWIGEGWRDINIDKLDRLLFFEIKIGADGSVVEANGWPTRWAGIRQATQVSGRPLDLTLTLFSVDDFNNLFSSATATQSLLENALKLANDEYVAGIHLDFEIYQGASKSALGNYQLFVKQLASALRELSPERQLSVFHPMGGSDVLYEAATLRALSAIVFQGYDAHWTGSLNAGPVAPLRGGDALTWEKIHAFILLQDIQEIPALISFPLYGYEWPVKGPDARSATRGVGSATTFAAVSRALLPDLPVNLQQRIGTFGATHDFGSGSAYYKYSLGKGEWFEGWFEDWWTLTQKFIFLRDKGLEGVAFFPLGYDNNYLVDYFYSLRSQPR